jgi:hypothetical protein
MERGEEIDFDERSFSIVCSHCRGSPSSHLEGEEYESQDMRLLTHLHHKLVEQDLYPSLGFRRLQKGE